MLRHVNFYSNDQALVQLECNLAHVRPKDNVISVPDAVIAESALALLKQSENDPSPVALEINVHLSKQDERFSSNNLLQQWLGRKVDVTQSSGIRNSRRHSGTLLYVHDGQSLVLHSDKTQSPLILQDVVAIAAKSQANSGQGNGPSQGSGQANRSNYIRLPNGLERVPRLLEVSYLTNGFRWSCSYRLLLNALGNTIVTGQVEAIAFNNTNFQLRQYQPAFVIGSPHRAHSAAAQQHDMESVQMVRASAAPSMAFASPMSVHQSSTRQSDEGQFFQFNGSRPLTLEPYSQVQYPLFHFDHQPVEPIFVYSMADMYGSSFQKATWGIELTSPVRALPPGQVILYQIENQLSTYLGASSIDRAIPPKQAVFLDIGDSEHLIGSHQIHKFEHGVSRLQPGYEVEYTITLTLKVGPDIPENAKLLLLFPDGNSEAHLLENHVQSDDDELLIDAPEFDAEKGGWTWNVHNFPVDGTCESIIKFYLVYAPSPRGRGAT